MDVKKTAMIICGTAGAVICEVAIIQIAYSKGRMDCATHILQQIHEFADENGLTYEPYAERELHLV